MDAHPYSYSPLSRITVDALAGEVAAGRFPYLVDVRREEAYAAATDVIRGARRRRPDRIAVWGQDIPTGASVVVYCVHGHEVSQQVCAALRQRGLDARYLDGGIEGWRAASGRMQARPAAEPGRWITRARPKIDRIACPWLVRRFIDPDARFFYVPADEVFMCGTEWQATPYDIPGAAYSHDGDACSFDAFIVRHGLADDPALAALAVIVRGADTGRPDLAPEAAGLKALSLGLSVMFPDDDGMLTRGLAIYDALYAWCASARAEAHGWPPVA